VADLQDRLQAALGPGYRVERELGGGGMSRVFLAEEVELGRQVVIKLLPPEMAAGVNVERFRREIQLAAKLQHPHIVPLLSAGASGDLLYYVMPFIKGESLRAKLSREGELPVGEAARILRDVADALAYAHGEGVVHRDIKPDNVLLSGQHAVVTDFGVAKAVSASTGESSLTSLGVALGTPAYMAPEQAVADPHLDHRADIYALGALGYEMLTGRPPFTGPNAQAVLSMHVLDAPQAVTLHRETVPSGLNDVIMRCLAKKPADRWQKAAEARAQFEAMVTPTGGITPTGARPVGASEPSGAAGVALAQHVAARAHPARVAALFAMAAAGIAAVLYATVRVVGLPGWVFVGGLGLLAIGFPIIVLTGYHERRRALARATGVSTMTPTGMKRLFTWRRALAGGGLAFAGLALVTGGFMSMRALGVGPFATLLSAGKLADRAKVVVADFQNHTTDSTLGGPLSDALRVDLSQSPVIRVMADQEIKAVLQRMERPATTPITPDVAREVAEREGAPAVIVTEVSSIGGSYALTARVVSTTDGSDLAAVRETATDEAAILPTLGRLSAKLREDIGESYRSLREAKPLEEVTTSSLEALRLFSRARQAEGAGDFAQAIELLKQAVTIDTAFGSAYRSLAVTYGNSGDPAGQVSAATAAMRHADRLPPVERYLAEAYYYQFVEPDPARVIAAYQGALAINTEQPAAINNLAVQYGRRHEWARAESLYRRGIAVSDSSVWQHFTNLAQMVFAQGRAGEARRTLDAFDRKQPGNPIALGYDAYYAYATGAYDSAITLGKRMAAAGRGSRVYEFWGNYLAMRGLLVQGRVAEADAIAAAGERIAADAGRMADALGTSLARAESEIVTRGRPEQGARMIDDALRRYPLDKMAPAERPFWDLVMLYAAADHATQAHAVLTRWERDVPPAMRGSQYTAARGVVAVVERRPDEGRQYLNQAFNQTDCTNCLDFWVGRSWEVSNRPEDAAAAYARFLDMQDMSRADYDATVRGPLLRRLGELNEQLGRREEALKRYGEFVELWKHADPDLQPMVADVKQRMAKLAGEKP
jgi:tetratricopeptide (TPR) repeat protein